MLTASTIMPGVIDTTSGVETARQMSLYHLLREHKSAFLPEDLAYVLREHVVSDDPAYQHRVLDLACGPGGWALDMAYVYPRAAILGIDSDSITISYAKAHAKVQGIENNVTFKAMNVRAPLPFPDSWFDVIHAPFLSSIVPQEAWPALLDECWRMLRPGGVLCITECEYSTTNSVSCRTLSDAYHKAITLAGMCPSIDVPHREPLPILAYVLNERNYHMLQQRTSILDFSAGNDTHVSMTRNILVFFELVKPFVCATGILPEEAFERLYEQALIDIYCDTFYGIWHMLNIEVQKP